MNSTIPWFPFKWKSVTLHGQVYPKAAMYLPFHFPDDSTEYALFFDTGNPSSIVYADKIKHITDVDKYNEGDFVTLKGDIQGKEMSHKFKMIKRVVDNSKSESEFGDASNLIGALGFDVFNKGYLMIDFANHKMAFAESSLDISELGENFSWLNASIKNGSCMVEILNKNKPLQFVFDCGSSIFPIITTEKIWKEITHRRGDELDNIIMEVSAYLGTVLKVKGAVINEDMLLGDLSFKEEMAYFIENPSAYNDFEKANMAGIIGNTAFYNDHLVVIDCVNNRFGFCYSNDRTKKNI